MKINDFELIERLVSKHGPTRADYPSLNEWFGRVHAYATKGVLSQVDINSLREAFGEAMSPATLQGFVCAKPHGYAGDFEIIDKIYTTHISPNPRLMRWDGYFHSQQAPKAVRNRKDYFHQLLDRHYARKGSLHVLKLASGPGRSMFEWLSKNKGADVNFDCIELDANAIQFAMVLNQDFEANINIRQQNVIRFRPTRQYDLIWAAGLFDYFSDKVFQSVLRRLIPAVAPGSELVIGNFSNNNASRPYMELVGDWHLHHRSASNSDGDG